MLHLGFDMQIEDELENTLVIILTWDIRELLLEMEKCPED